MRRHDQRSCRLAFQHLPSYRRPLLAGRVLRLFVPQQFEIESQRATFPLHRERKAGRRRRQIAAKICVSFAGGRASARVSNLSLFCSGDLEFGDGGGERTLKDSVKEMVNDYNVHFVPRK